MEKYNREFDKKKKNEVDVPDPRAFTVKSAKRFPQFSRNNPIVPPAKRLGG